jgi:hypothetical protein
MSNPSHGAKLNDKTDGGDNENICTIHFTGEPVGKKKLQERARSRKILHIKDNYLI